MVVSGTFLKPTHFCHYISSKSCPGVNPLPPPNAPPKAVAKGDIECAEAEKHAGNNEVVNSVENSNTSSLPAVGTTPAPKIPLSTQEDQLCLPKVPLLPLGDTPAVPSKDPPSAVGDPPWPSHTSVTAKEMSAIKHLATSGKSENSKHSNDEKKVCLLR